jgi:hypothetical protein
MTRLTMLHVLKWYVYVHNDFQLKQKSNLLIRTTTEFSPYTYVTLFDSINTY